MTQEAEKSPIPELQFKAIPWEKLKEIITRSSLLQSQKETLIRLFEPIAVEVSDSLEVLDEKLLAYEKFHEEVNDAYDEIKCNWEYENDWELAEKILRRLFNTGVDDLHPLERLNLYFLLGDGEHLIEDEKIGLALDELKETFKKLRKPKQP